MYVSNIILIELLIVIVYAIDTVTGIAMQAD